MQPKNVSEFNKALNIAVSSPEASLGSHKIEVMNTKGLKAVAFGFGLFGLMSVAFVITSIVFPIFAVFIAGAAILTLLGTVIFVGVTHFYLKNEEPKKTPEINETRNVPEPGGARRTTLHFANRRPIQTPQEKQQISDTAIPNEELNQPSSNPHFDQPIVNTREEPNPISNTVTAITKKERTLRNLEDLLNTPNSKRTASQNSWLVSKIEEVKKDLKEPGRK